MEIAEATDSSRLCKTNWKREGLGTVWRVSSRGGPLYFDSLPLFLPFVLSPSPLPFIWPHLARQRTVQYHYSWVPPPLSSPDIFISIFLLFSGFFCHLHAQPTYTQQQNNCSCCEIWPDFIYFVSSLPPHSVFSLFFIPWKISRYKIQEKRLDKNYLKWLVNGRASRDAWRHIHQTPLAQDPSSWLVVWIPAETRNNDFQEK